MNNVIHTAVAYRDRLKLEIGRIEDFLRLADELINEDRAVTAGLAAPKPFVPGMDSPSRGETVAPAPAEAPAGAVTATMSGDRDEEEVGLVLRAAQPARGFPVQPVTLPAAAPANRATRGSLFRGACTSPEELRLAIAS